jgi:hypothetical protein
VSYRGVNGKRPHRRPLPEQQWIRGGLLVLLLFQVCHTGPEAARYGGSHCLSILGS